MPAAASHRAVGPPQATNPHYHGRGLLELLLGLFSEARYHHLAAVFFAFEVAQAAHGGHLGVLAVRQYGCNAAEGQRAEAGRWFPVKDGDRATRKAAW